MNKKELIVLLSTVQLFFLSSYGSLKAQQPNEMSKVRGITGARKSDDPSRVFTNKQTRFLRITKDASGKPESLETSITRYQSNDGKLLIDLIGVIHVGEEKYYRKLNHQFQLYDSLLYELVAPANSRVPQRDSGSHSANPINWLQNSMQQVLGLESQLKHIDYTKKNFVHADLSPRQIQKKIADRGDTPLSLGLRAISEMMNQANRQVESPSLANEISGFDDLFNLLNDPKQLKIMMATQFASGDLDSGLGNTLNQLLITDRNQAAMKVLNAEVEKGQKRIGIFYGAAHMPDFEERLISMGLKKTKQAWVEAWDLQSAKRSSIGQWSNLIGPLLESLDR